jgi:anti-sigma factor RsiW
MDPQASNQFSRNGLARKAYACADSRKRLWEYLDDELPKIEAHQVGRHVANCPFCGPLAAFARRFLERIAAVRRESGDLAALRTRIVRMLDVRR